MNISKFLSDKPRVVIGSAILAAIGLYLLAERGLVPRNYQRVKEANQEMGGIKSLAQAKGQDVSDIQIEQLLGKPRSLQATLEEVRWLQQEIEQLNKRTQELREKHKIRPLGYWDAFPPGHPYGPRDPDDIIIFYPPLQSSFSGVKWSNRSIFDRVEERNARRQERTNK